MQISKPGEPTTTTGSGPDVQGRPGIVSPARQLDRCGSAPNPTRDET
jgi:hypothetical protein